MGKATQIKVTLYLHLTCCFAPLFVGDHATRSNLFTNKEAMEWNYCRGTTHTPPGAAWPSPAPARTLRHEVLHRSLVVMARFNNHNNNNSNYTFSSKP